MRFRLALAVIVLAAPLAGSANAQARLWYWCETARAYYPYVTQCTVPWRPVNPATVLSQPNVGSQPPATSLPPTQQIAPSAPLAAPAATITADYRSMLAAWLEAHKRYPETARQRGEQGKAVLRFRVDRSGRVLDYAVVSGTGYADLDAATEAMMRGVTLPPFPVSMNEPEIEVSVTIRFDLASTQPNAGQPQTAMAAQVTTAAYVQGGADWDALHAWFDEQVGDSRAGADYWATNRSKAGHLLCAEAVDNYPGDKAAFVAGCQDAKGRLDPIDVRRADPQYRAGFNDEAKRLPISAGAVLNQNASAVQSQLPTPSVSFSSSLASEPAYAGPHVAPDLSATQNYLFRTRITAASQENPNFAGRYVISVWGCGTGCAQGVAVNVATGKVVWLPGSFVLEPLDAERYQYRLDSLLLIVNGHESEDDETPYAPRCYLLDDETYPRLVKKDCLASASAAASPGTPLPAAAAPSPVSSQASAAPPVLGPKEGYGGYGQNSPSTGTTAAPGPPPNLTPAAPPATCPNGFHNVGSGCLRDDAAPSRVAEIPASQTPAPSSAAPTQSNVATSTRSPPSDPEVADRAFWWIAGAVIALLLTGTTWGVGYFVYPRLRRQHPKQDAHLNPEGLLTVGAQGVVSLPIVNGQGKARMGSKVWSVEGPNLPEGAQVMVKSVHGERIIVEAVASKARETTRLT
jgi:TonB family protein